MADNDLSTITSPYRTMGIDPDEARANPQLLAQLMGQPTQRMDDQVRTVPTMQRMTDRRMFAPNPPPISVSPESVNRPPVVNAPQNPAGISGVLNTPSATPSPVAPSAEPTNLTWQQRMAKQAAEKQMAAGQTQEEALKRFQTQPSEAEALAPLESQRTQAAQYINPQEQQYRPTVGQKILRGLQGVARGGVLGPLAVDYNAPNRQYGRDVAAQTSRVGGIDQQINEARKAWEDASGRIGKEAGLARDVATSYADVSKQIAEQEQAENTAALDAAKVKQDEAAAAKAGKPTNYEQTVIAAQGETDPNGPLHRAAKEMRDTEVRKFKATNSGRQPTETELWSQAFQTEYGRKPTAEEIASKRVAGGGTAGGAVAKPANLPARAQSREAFEMHWSKRLGPGSSVERKYDAQRTAVVKDTDMNDAQKKAKFDQIEAERDDEKQKLQDEKDAEAAQYGVYNQPAAGAPSPVAPAQPAAARPAANKADTYTYKGSTYTKGQVVPVDGKPHIITGFNAKTGKLQTKPQ